MTTFHSSPSSPRVPILTLLEIQRRVLGRVAAEAPLAEVLEEIARGTEVHLGNGALASISLLDEAGRCLHVATAPGLSEHYKQTIDGASAAAAFSGEPVYVTDMMTDPLGAEYRTLALSHGLKACWAMPIRGTDNHVLGTLTIYSMESKDPSGDEIEAMTVAAHSVALVIERQRYRKSLRNREARHHQIVNSATDFAIVSTDRSGIITSWNEGAHRILGWSEQEIVGHTVHCFLRQTTSLPDGQKLKCALRFQMATQRTSAGM
jgi:GAF domain-containing protein